MQHKNITVHGQVQGVYFRAHAKAEADRLGLNGFARNQPDGSVYLEVEGSPTALDTFIAWCHKGSPGAIVENVNYQSADLGGHTGFRTY